MKKEHKKLALLRILQILYKHSGPEYPLLQEDIQFLLEEEFGIEIERKAVSRNLALLREAGFEIAYSTKRGCSPVKGGSSPAKRGCYLAKRQFADPELRLLIDAVLVSGRISGEHVGELIAKIGGLGNEYFQFRMDNLHCIGDRSEEGNDALFEALSSVDTAIADKRQIEFGYARRHVNGDVTLEKRRAIPRRLILHDRRYYLLAHDGERLAFYRLDRMSDIGTVCRTRALLPEPVWDEAAEERAIAAVFAGRIETVKKQGSD